MRTLLSCLALVAFAQAADIIDPDTCTQYPCLIFEDNFDFLDHEAWVHEINMGGGGNYEFQVYVNNRSISYTRDSLLFIKPDVTANWKGEEFLYEGELDLWGMNGDNDVCTSNLFEGCKQTGTDAQIISPALSARLRSYNNFEFKYGTVEVRAKIPKADWMWPALWMLPWRSPYGGWPVSGEMDIIEARSNNEYGDNQEFSHYIMGTTMHWGPYWPVNRYPWTKEEFPSPLGDDVSFAEEFHTWKFEWTKDFLRLSVNDEEKLFVDPITNFWEYGNFTDLNADNPWAGREKMAPFDQKFYFIINVAIGGTGGYFPDDVYSNPPKPWLNTSPTAKLDFWNGRDSWYPSWTQGLENRTSENAAFQIDYIRVYKNEPDN